MEVLETNLWGLKLGASDWSGLGLGLGLVLGGHLLEYRVIIHKQIAVVSICLAVDLGLGLG